MACAREHWFLLETAVRASSWHSKLLEEYQGWEAGAADPLNRMATISDEIGDWLWHKPPWSEVALDFGSQRVAADVVAGDEVAATLKAAFLSHCVVDALAVSHVWLDLLAELEDFPDEHSLRRLHDPVENMIAGPIADISLHVERENRSFASMYQDCEKEAKRIAQQIVVDFRSGRNPLPHCLAGVRNSMRAMALYFDAVAAGDTRLACGVEAEPRLQHWPGRELLSWDGERLLSALADPETTMRLRTRLGWNGRNIFFESWGCSQDARQDFWLYRRDRATWRKHLDSDK